MGATSIEWTDFSVNPIKFRLNLASGPKLVNMCTVCSTGCKNCYSAGITKRFWPKEAGEFPGYTAQALKLGEFVIDESKLHEVLRRKKPTKFFWCDMTDMFHPSVPFEIVDQCFAVMALTPHHTHQVLTKRPERMAEYFDERRIWDAVYVTSEKPARLTWTRFEPHELHHRRWPLPNVWLGTSVENQKAADERIPDLLKVPAAVRFLSTEPLLEAVNVDLTGIHWVIVGGESGRGARSCATDWIHDIIRQSRRAGVPVFVKQLGGKPVVFDCGAGDEFIPDAPGYVQVGYRGKALRDKKGGDWNEWAEHLRVREFPTAKAVA